MCVDPEPRSGPSGASLFAYCWWQRSIGMMTAAFVPAVVLVGLM
jgi:hypothetical protein